MTCPCHKAEAAVFNGVTEPTNFFINRFAAAPCLDGDAPAHRINRAKNGVTPKQVTELILEHLHKHEITKVKVLA